MGTTNKKVRKLRKSRIWPSLILFLVSLIVGGILIAAEFCIYASYVLESEYMREQTEAKSIARRVDDRMRMGDDAEAALLQISEGMENGILVVDQEMTPVASCGQVTVDLFQKTILDMGDEQEIYWDQETIRTIRASRFGQGDLDQMDAFHVLVTVLLNKVSLQEILHLPTHENLMDVMMECVYWQPEPLSTGQGQVLVQRDLTIRRDDLVFGFAITAVSAFMFLLIITLQFINVVSKICSHRRLEKLLMMDKVTGGNNWIGFEQKAIRLLEKRDGAGRTYAVLDLAILKYQSFCSLYGIRAGEELLLQMDRLLGEKLTKKETFGHVGGADFALLLAVEPGEDGKIRTVERVRSLCDALPHANEKKNSKQTDDAMLNFRAGIYFLTPEERKKAAGRRVDLDSAYMNAGMAKASAGQEAGAVACFSQKMLEEQLWQHKVENTMQAALDHEEFQVYLQPKYNPNSGELQGAEALVRWLSPTEGLIPPGWFVPIFEKTGFVTKLDDYMISHVARLQRQWLQEGRKIVPISVNVSRAHFAQPDLAEHIRDLVDEYQVPHESIEIELTESAFFDDKDIMLNTVHKLQEYGFEVSMDDFGSGYSSLNSLKDLPLNVLKLDAEFFRGDDFDTRGEIVVSEAIALAKQLNMKIVAEGVEKQEQVDFLARQNCDMIQGYYYAKPMPAAEYAQRLKE